MCVEKLFAFCWGPVEVPTEVQVLNHTHLSLIWKLRRCHPPTAGIHRRGKKPQRRKTAVNLIYFHVSGMGIHGHVVKPFSLPPDGRAFATVVVLTIY